MKSIKTLVTILLVAFAAFVISGRAFAQTFSDVSDDFWAAKEINSVVSGNIMQGYKDGTFKPNKSVSRVEFVKMLLVVLGNDKLQITTQNKFIDINEKTQGYDDILRSDQLGLVYGYTDNTFLPERHITKAETSSVMSHITKETYTDISVLDSFIDKAAIPAWDVVPYAKAIKYGLYVNYPNENELLPNKKLNRAEAAVLLSKLKSKIAVVEDKYKNEEPKEEVLRTEHLNVSPNAEVNTVTITNLRKIVDSKNLLKAYFEEDFYSKKHCVGDIVTMYAKEDVYTTEGTLIIPAGTKMVAEISSLERPKWMNKNAKVNLLFKKLVFPCDCTVSFCAKNCKVLTENRWQKPLIYAVTDTAIGAGLAVAHAGYVGGGSYYGKDLAVGLPVGFASGVITGLVTPGVNYKAKKDEMIIIYVLEPISIYYK